MNIFFKYRIQYLLTGFLLLAILIGCGEKAEKYFPESSPQASIASRAIQIDRSAAAAPEIYVQMGHPDNGYTADTVAVFTPDGRHILTGSADGRVILWDTESGREIRTFRCRDQVTDLAVSKDGRYLACGCQSSADNIHVWEISSGKKIRSFSLEKPNGPPLVFCQNGRSLLAGGDDGLLRMWDVASGKLIREFKTVIHGEVSALVLAPDGQKVVAGFRLSNSGGQTGSTISVWDLNTGVNSLSFNTGKETVALAVTPDGRRLLSADFGKDNVQLWDLQTGAPLRSYLTGGTGAIAVSAAGRYALFGGNRNFSLVELATGKQIRKIDSGINDWVKSICFSPDGRSALVSDQSLRPTLWDLTAGTLRFSLGGNAGETMAAAFPAGGDILMSGYGYSNSISLWNYATGRQLRRIKNDPGCLSRAAAISPDGHRVAFAGWDMTARNAFVSIWNADTAEKIAKIYPTEKSDMHANAPVFTRDGRKIIWALGADIIISDSETGAKMQRFRVGRFEKNEITPDPTGRYLLASAGSPMPRHLVDLATGQVRKTFPDPCAFSPDGQTLYTLTVNSDRTVLLKQINLATLQETRLFEVDFQCLVPDGNRELANYIEHFMAGPNGAYLFFSDSGKHLIYRIDLRKKKITARMKGHTDEIFGLGLSPDGRLLCSAGRDGTTRLWDTATGKEAARFITFSDGEWIIITPEGYYNTSAEGDRYLNVRRGDRVYGIDNFRQSFFRPDLVRVALAGGSLHDFRKLADVKPPPRVRFVDTPTAVDTGELTVKLRLEDQGGGIGDVRIYLNGTAVVMDGRGVQVTPAEPIERVRTYSLQLTGGENTITAVAFNGDNTVQSNEAALEVAADFAAPRKPSLYALVVGINQFKNPRLRLNYSVADAGLFADTLARGARGLFKKVDIRRRTTPTETSRAAILGELDTMRALRPDDLFVFYIASHGTVDDGEYFLITSNVGSLRTEKLKTDAITQDLLTTAIANIPATKKLIVIDTCSAGALGKAIQVAMMTRGLSEDTALKILSRAVGSTILSASTSRQEALEGYQGHGLFTYALVQGLAGKADLAGTGYVKTTTLADYVDNEVPLLAEKVFHRAQYPTISTSGQAFPIVRARN